MHILSLNHRRAAWHEQYCFETKRRTLHTYSTLHITIDHHIIVGRVLPYEPSYPSVGWLLVGRFVWRVYFILKGPERLGR